MFAIAVAIPITAGLALLAGLRHLRRHGRPDPTGEIVVTGWLAWSIAVAAVRLFWPDAPAWVWHALLFPALAGCVTFAAIRLRQSPTCWRDLRNRAHTDRSTNC